MTTSVVIRPTTMPTATLTRITAIAMRISQAIPLRASVPNTDGDGEADSFTRPRLPLTDQRAVKLSTPCHGPAAAPLLGGAGGGGGGAAGGREVGVGDPGRPGPRVPPPAAGKAGSRG